MGCTVRGGAGNNNGGKQKNLGFICWDVKLNTSLAFMVQVDFVSAGNDWQTWKLPKMQ